MKTIFRILLLIIPLLTSCQASEKSTGEGETMRHATLLAISHADDYTICTIRNPWDTTKILHTYVLTSNPNASRTHPEGTVVVTPLKNTAVFTAVHCSLMREMGLQKSIGGVCDAEYIVDKDIKQSIASGTIKNLGNSMSPNTEAIVALAPDAIMLSPFEGNGGYGQLETTGIPIIECADYMEVSPLARAEWMKFYGELFGCRSLADSLFDAIETEYNSLKKKTAKASNRPTLLVEMPMTDGTWYVPGGRSTMGQIYKDAGADYFMKGDSSAGSLPLSIENVVMKAADCDLWLLKYAGEEMTLDRLAKQNDACRQMKAWGNGNVFGCNTTATPFYEATPFHPEVLLRELVGIVHPEIVPFKGEFFKKIKAEK